MDPITLLVSLGAALVSGGLATVVTSRRVAAREQREAADEIVRVREQERATRGKVETRLLQAQAEVEQLRRLNLLTEGSFTPPERPQRQHLDALTRQLQGFAFVDAVVIADAAGLTLSSGGSSLDDDLAAAVPALQSALEQLLALGLPAVELRVVLGDLLHVVARPLPAWTGGAWLLAAATSQFPNPLAVAAAVARAELGAPEPLRVGLRSLRGTTTRTGDRGTSSATLLEELDALVRSTKASLVLVGKASTSLLAVHQDGPSGEVSDALLVVLEQLRERLATRLRQPAEQVSALAPGACAHLHLLGGSLRLLVLGPDTQLDPLTLPRLGGRIKRLVAGSASVTDEVAA